MKRIKTRGRCTDMNQGLYVLSDALSKIAPMVSAKLSTHYEQ